MTKRAAFFDLDRTLLGDSSGFIIMAALVEKGLISERQKSLADVGRRIFNVLGETRVGMELTRRSISRLAGWTRRDLREAAERSLEKLDAAVYTEARTLIDRHHAHGDLVVIATSTGRDMVEALADRLGVDRLIATDYEEADGKLTGRTIGKWLWGPDKAEAVKEFAEREGIDLADSFAYSDSYFDRHLLEMVGYPRPVNPDPLFRAYAVRKGWPVLEFSNLAGIPKMALEPYDLLRPMAHPLLSPVQMIVEGVQLIPRKGPVIIAANHRSYLDPVILAFAASRQGRKLRYLGKKEVFDAPVLGQFAKLLGQIRVDRGSGDGTALQQAIEALNAGEAIGIFPQGTIPRGEAFFDPDLHGKSGVARLAVATDAPVVPVAMWDNEKIWPRSSRLPNVMEMVTRRPVHVKVGEPMQLKLPAGADESVAYRELTQQVMDAISALLPDEVRNPKRPTAEQIEAATPPDA
jgi:putative phosphoserine phosphatase/1-acylglycerol-3-phosphate O-acyltransferase